jgi:hypothetical protein
LFNLVIPRADPQTELLLQVFTLWLPISVTKGQKKNSKPDSTIQLELQYLARVLFYVRKYKNSIQRESWNAGDGFGTGSGTIRIFSRKLGGRGFQ